MMRAIMTAQALAVFVAASLVATKGAPGIAFFLSLGALYMLVEAFEA